MNTRCPIILALPGTQAAYRWRLVAAVYDSGRAMLEGALVLIVMLVVCVVRTRLMSFVCLAAAAAIITSARLWDRRQYLRAVSASGAGDMPGTPEGWMRRHAIGAVAIGAVWGGQSACALLLTADVEVQLFALMLQGGWIAATCVRMAASPLAVIAQVMLTLGVTVICLVLAPHGLMRLAIPTTLLHIVALLRISRSLGRLLLQDMQSAQRFESLNIQLSEANVKLTRLSVIDGLTGITNRRGFDEALAAEWGRASRDERHLALLLIDVDFFKLYNDHYGHLAGDDCLRAVAAQVADCVSRPTDLAARYGGEEFVALLAGTNEEGALHVAEQVRAAVDAMRMAHEQSPFGHVSVSIGVASLVPAAAEDRQSLIRRADAALYAAKQSGRHRVRGALSSAATVQPEAAQPALPFFVPEHCA